MMLGLILGAPATEPTLWMITLYGVIGQILVFFGIGRIDRNHLSCQVGLYNDFQKRRKS